MKVLFISSGNIHILNPIIENQGETLKRAGIELEYFTISDERYIAYCGYMWGDKDGVSILIESFAKISSNYPGLKLYLIGDTSNIHEFQKMQNKIQTLNITHKVVFTGRVERDDMPALLDGAFSATFKYSGTGRVPN